LLLERLKVLVLREVEIFCSCFNCWRFLLILLDVKSSYFYFLMLKVFALTLRCRRFLFYSWMLKVFYSWSFVYLHILKKNDVIIYSILFRSSMYKLV
jgi:hypothetical protein